MIEAENMQKYRLKKHYVRRLCIVGTIVVICFILYNTQLFHPPIFKSKAAIELNFYMDTMKNQCTTNPDEHVYEINQNVDLKQFFKLPNCINILENLSKGRWLRAKEYNYDLEHELNDIHSRYRIKVGIPPMPWRNDDKCGYNVLMQKISREWPQTGTFCNPRGPNPCCTNLFKGKCVPVTSTMKCDCATCIDTSQYTDALLAEWITHENK